MEIHLPAPLGVKAVKVKYLLAFLILFLGALLRWYHAFGVKAVSYGSGDAFDILLKSLTLETDKTGYYLMSYFFRIAHEVIGLSYWNMTFFVMPVIGLLLALMFFMILSKIDFILGALALFLIVINPYLAYYSTEPSKAIFVLFYFVFSLLFFQRFIRAHQWKELGFSFIFFAFGALFYHAIFLFLPFYAVLWTLEFSRMGGSWFKKWVQSAALFAAIFLLIAGPYYAYQKVQNLKVLEEKPIEIRTEADTYGGIFQHQLSAMLSAISSHRDKLGYINLKTGVERYMNVVDIRFIFGFLFIFSGLLWIKKRKFLSVFPLLGLYAFCVIALQWTSFSHGSRYPQYMVYFLLAGLAICFWEIHGHIVGRWGRGVFLGGLIFISFLWFLPFQRIGGLRNVYIPQIEIGQIASKKIQLDSDHQILYIGWPAITLSLMGNFDLNRQDWLHTFGWGWINLDTISAPDYIQKNHIRYYILDKTADDYFESTNVVFNKLKNNFKMELLAKTSRPDIYTALYAIKEKK